jgi:serine/threonine protein kinase
MIIKSPVTEREPNSRVNLLPAAVLEAGMPRMSEPTLPHNPKSATDFDGPSARPLGCGNEVTTQVEDTRPVRFIPPERFFGNYELLAEVARGGMGVVYRARQVGLNRTVALKMILAGKLADGDEVVRFRTEAEAAARLSHPNIVAVHEVGEVQGRHFFSMDFIEGTSLAQRLTRGPLSGRDAARYVLKIAKAVHYAHRQDILHRDIKPSNIMLDAEDEPRITDFGLAKRLGDHDSGQTRTGAILGTPSYMAPEQAQGRTRDLGPACDIYSLGAMLYELLTGRPPFRAETPIDTVMQVIHNDPVPATLLNPNIDKDLETICHKCLEKDPALRYPTAEALAQDLQSFLDGNSITARSFNVIDRLTRMLDRSQHDADFTTWSAMVLWMAGIVGLQHALIFLFMSVEAPRWLILSARTLEFVLLGCLFWYNRRKSRLLPTTSAERELWTIWIGYFFAVGATVAATRLVRAMNFIDPTDHAPLHLEELLPYPFLAILSGLAFFVMGNNYWGRCYALGVGFFALACFMPFWLNWAPLAYGVYWSLALTMVGFHLRGFSYRRGASVGATAGAQAPTVQASRR